MAHQGKGDRSPGHAGADGKPQDGKPARHDAHERPRSDPGRATDAERRSGGNDDRARSDPGRAYDAERQSGRDGDPRVNGRPK